MSGALDDDPRIEDICSLSWVFEGTNWEARCALPPTPSRARDIPLKNYKIWTPWFLKLSDIRLWIVRANGVNDVYNFVTSLMVGHKAPNNILAIAKVKRLSKLTSIQPDIGNYNEKMEQNEWELHSKALKAYIARLVSMQDAEENSAWQHDLAKLIRTLILNRVNARRIRAQLLGVVGVGRSATSQGLWQDARMRC